MSTPINFATDLYLADNATITAGKLVPVIDLVASSVILKMPVMGPGGSGVIHVTGTFNTANFGLFSALSPDADGWNNSYSYTLHSAVFTGGPTTTTFDYAFGTGVEQYDDAVTAGELYVLVNPGNWHEITAISFDYTEPGSTTTPVNTAVPLRQFPRDDGRQTASARRNFPPPKSYQSSIRRGGGYL